MSTSLRISVEQFSLSSFKKAIFHASGASEETISIQADYLVSFLSNHDARAQTTIREQPYIDRHYLEEHSHYYATAFRPPPHQTTRLHLFSDVITRADLEQWLTDATHDQAAYEDVRVRLNNAYLGFVVVRPIADAPIGRTILRPYSELSDRHFETARIHRVHILGFELKIRGVPFQQQEVAVGACATTAVWSALSVVARAAGQRGPTPYQITEAATRYLLNDRVLPAEGGLDRQQILDSIRVAGFSPHRFVPMDSFEMFSLIIQCYLRSGIPVILQVNEPRMREYHAITAVGFKASASPLELKDGTKQIRFSGMSRIYVHEDRLGPYARMRWLRHPSDESPQLKYEPYSSSQAWSSEPMTVSAAIVPLYPKLRLSASALIGIAAELHPLFRALVDQAKRDEVSVECRYAMGGKYIEELLRRTQPAARAIEIALSLTLPRYVGVIRFLVGKDCICDVICDSTDISRSVPQYKSVLVFVTHQPSILERLKSYASERIKHARVE